MDAGAGQEQRGGELQRGGEWEGARARVGGGASALEVLQTEETEARCRKFRSKGDRPLKHQHTQNSGGATQTEDVFNWESLELQSAALGDRIGPKGPNLAAGFY